MFAFKNTFEIIIENEIMQKMKNQKTNFASISTDLRKK